MVTISPSLLSCDFLNIEKEIRPFENFPNFWFHLDIMDGHFVPNLTFGPPIVKLISQKTKQKLDAHCMVSNPEWHMNAYKDMGLHNFTFHLEACEDSLKLVRMAKKIYPSVGISIRPGTDVSEISNELFRNINLLLLMSVEPGFGGQSFLENTYLKLEQIQKKKNELNLKLEIQVDGGVSDKNAKKLIEHGVTNLVAGSYIFKAGPSEYEQRVNSLRKD